MKPKLLLVMVLWLGLGVFVSYLGSLGVAGEVHGEPASPTEAVENRGH